jgi:hypothetical protein
MDGISDVIHRARPVEPTSKAEEIPAHERLRRRYATLRNRYPHIRDMAPPAELEAFATVSELKRYPPEA